MKNPSRSQTIIITTIIFYLIVIFFPGDNYALPMAVNVITELTNLIQDHSKGPLLNGLVPLVALMILMIATSDRVINKSFLFVLAIVMLAPSVLQAFKMNRQINGWSLITFSVLPFCIVAFIGVVYFVMKWVKKYMRDI
jgi:hypothetical protein